jgi:ATP-binding cassette subfamily B protein
MDDVRTAASKAPSLHAIRGRTKRLPPLRVGVGGPVGSGKSALAKALLGLYPLAGGTVSLDGDAPARHRGDIGYLPQEPFLFSGTVRENITMGREQADLATMSALEIAALAKDVAGFEHGVDAEIGERGIRISGGQRQRVALARAAAAGPRPWLQRRRRPAVGARGSACR